MEPEPGRFELGALHLSAGEGTRVERTVSIVPIKVGTEEYAVDDVTAQLDVARMVGGGYSLRLRAEAVVRGTCLRCLDVIAFDRSLDVREIDRPQSDDDEDIAAEDDDLLSPYVDGDSLELAAWVRDSLVLDLPATMAPPTDDQDRCTLCARTLQDLGAPAVGGGETQPDPRWAKLREIELDDQAQS